MSQRTLQENVVKSVEHTAVVCDGCGFELRNQDLSDGYYRVYGAPYAAHWLAVWYEDRKSSPGDRATAETETIQHDFCPECKPKVLSAGVALTRSLRKMGGAAKALLESQRAKLDVAKYTGTDLWRKHEVDE